MDHITSVVDRIQAIEARVRPDAPAGGFRQALARTAQAAATAPAGDRQLVAAGDRATGQPTSLTLAQMLGRPVTSVVPAPLPGAPAGSPATDSGEALRLPVDAPMSSPFGMRVHPITGQRRPHNGIDLAAPTGTPIAAAADGTVSFAGWQGGYGNIVIIDHGDGTETRYAHQDSIGVTAGQGVQAGQSVGTVGSTGASTGAHLHFELRRNGEPIDPAPLLGL